MSFYVNLAVNKDGKERKGEEYSEIYQERQPLKQRLNYLTISPSFSLPVGPADSD